MGEGGDGGGGRGREGEGGREGGREGGTEEGTEGGGSDSHYEIILISYRRRFLIVFLIP